VLIFIYLDSVNIYFIDSNCFTINNNHAAQAPSKVILNFLFIFISNNSL
jgi:hypothetical protein